MTNRSIRTWGLALGAWALALGALFAQTPAEQTNALARRAAERLAALQKEAEGLAKQEQTLLVDLRKLEVDREIKLTEYEQTTGEADLVTEKLALATNRAESLQGEADRQLPDVEARLVRVYKMGRAGYWRM